MHKHNDGGEFTPPMIKLKSTSGLHSHGDDYTMAYTEANHTHINKETKDRTGGPLDPATKLEDKNAITHSERTAKKEGSPERLQKLKKAAKKVQKEKVENKSKSSTRKKVKK